MAFYYIEVFDYICWIYHYNSKKSFKIYTRYEGNACKTFQKSLNRSKKEIQGFFEKVKKVKQKHPVIAKRLHFSSYLSITFHCHLVTTTYNYVAILDFFFFFWKHLQEILELELPVLSIWMERLMPHHCPPVATVSKYNLVFILSLPSRWCCERFPCVTDISCSFSVGIQGHCFHNDAFASAKVST